MSFYQKVKEYLKQNNCEYLDHEDWYIFYRDLKQNKVFAAKEEILAKKINQE